MVEIHPLSACRQSVRLRGHRALGRWRDGVQARRAPYHGRGDKERQAHANSNDPRTRGPSDVVRATIDPPRGLAVRLFRSQPIPAPPLRENYAISVFDCAAAATALSFAV